LIAGSYGRTCRICGGSLLSAEDELVCSSCGAVNDSPSTEEAQQAPRIRDIQSAQLGSFLGPQSNSSLRKYSGFIFSRSTPDYMKLLSDHGLMGQTERTTEYLTDIIRRACELLRLPASVCFNAQLLASRMARETQFRRGTLPTLAAYSILTVCRQTGVLALSWKKLIQCLSSLGYTVRLRHVISVTTRVSEKSPVNIESCLTSFISKLISELRPDLRRPRGLDTPLYSSGLLREAKRILLLLGEERLIGYSPFAVAATAIYLAECTLAESERRRRLFSQKRFAQILGVSKFTLREQTAKFRKYLRSPGPKLIHQDILPKEGPPAPREPVEASNWKVPSE
jgi:transcription initiation factor TFIIIB Brf1 subunit/transcription initiation factor TFIIB